MFRTLKTSWIVWLEIGLIGGLGAGLIGGLLLGGLWPSTPLQAVSTDRTKTFAMATGPVDEDFEAVFFLDFLTGDLNAVVLGRQGNAFTAFYQTNVINALGVDATRNPSYMMVTGMANMRGMAGQVRPSLAVVYIAEITTGKVAAYAIPWSKTAHAANRVIGPMPLQLVAGTSFRIAAGGEEPAPIVPR